MKYHVQDFSLCHIYKTQEQNHPLVEIDPPKPLCTAHEFLKPSLFERFYFDTSLTVWLGTEFQVGNTFPSECWELCSRVFWLPVKKPQTTLISNPLCDLLSLLVPSMLGKFMMYLVLLFSCTMGPFNLETHVFLFNWKFLLVALMFFSLLFFICVCSFLLFFKEVSLSRCWVSCPGHLIFFLIF